MVPSVKALKSEGRLLLSAMTRFQQALISLAWRIVSRSLSMSNFLPVIRSHSAMSSRSCAST